MRNQHHYRWLKRGLSLAPLVCTVAATADQSSSAQIENHYTTAADIRLERSWDAYVTGNFIYWEALQDNMEAGVVSAVATSAVTFDGKMINNNVEYKPGFQVGLGFGSNYDGWNTFLEYTWFHSEQHTRKAVTLADSLVIHPTWIAPSSLKFHSTSQQWKLELSSLDWTLSRRSHIGSRLTLSPSFGLRAAWIDQQAHVDYFSLATAQTTFYRGKSDSWGLGAKFGLSSHWLLGQGFKIYGDLDGDILYTRYTKLRSHEGRQAAGSAPVAQKITRQHHLSALRPHSDVELGLGWGADLGRQACHIELALGYGFQVFWSQNMFRKSLDDVALGASISPNGNLYIQGLNASVRFDF